MYLIDKTGIITFRTSKGLMQVYVKNDEAFLSLVRDDLVTYLDLHDVDDLMPPMAKFLYKALPNGMALSLLAKNIMSSKEINIQNHYYEDEKIIKLKNGKKYTKYNITTANNKKVENLFNEYEEHKDKFKGFCNYKVDGLGNISDVEVDLLKQCVDIKYSLEEYSKKQKDDTNTEKYLRGIFDKYLEKNIESIGDVKKIEFEKFDNELSEVDKHKKDSQEDYIYALVNQKRNIESKLRDIDNIKAYVNDSRINDIYEDSDIIFALSELYLREKIMCRKDKEEIKLILGKSYVDEKLISILGEDIVMTSKEESRKNFEDFSQIKYFTEMAKIKRRTESEKNNAKETEVKSKKIGCTEEETNRALKILKRYVDIVQSYDILSEETTHEDSVRKDEIAIIMRNYEKYICAGLLNDFGINSVSFEDIKFLNSLKNSVIKEKVQYDDIISFTVDRQKLKDENAEEADKENKKKKEKEITTEDKDKVLFTYITKDKKLYTFRDNKAYDICDENEEKEKYIEHASTFRKKAKMSDIIGKGNFAYVEDKVRIHIDPGYQEQELEQYEEKMDMTLNILDDLDAREKDEKAKLNVVEKDEVKKFQELLKDGNIEDIIDFIQIKRSKKALENVEALGQKEETTEVEKENTQEEIVTLDQE